MLNVLNKLDTTIQLNNTSYYYSTVWSDFGLCTITAAILVLVAMITFSILLAIINYLWTRNLAETILKIKEDQKATYILKTLYTVLLMYCAGIFALRFLNRMTGFWTIFPLATIFIINLCKTVINHWLEKYRENKNHTIPE